MRFLCSFIFQFFSFISKIFSCQRGRSLARGYTDECTLPYLFSLEMAGGTVVGNVLHPYTIVFMTHLRNVKDSVLFGSGSYKMEENLYFLCVCHLPTPLNQLPYTLRLPLCSFWSVPSSNKLRIIKVRRAIKTKNCLL